MSNRDTPSMKPVAPGLVLALLSILFGFGLGGAFGVNEDAIKGHLRSSAEAVLDSAYGGDTAKMDKVVSKSWSYMKRAHLHGGAIGAAALASILLIAMTGGTGALEKLTSLAFGAGGLVYSIFWLAAALAAPGLGSTGAAKEAYEWLAIPGAGMCMIGIVGTLVITIRHAYARPAR